MENIFLKISLIIFLLKAHVKCETFLNFVSVCGDNIYLPANTSRKHGKSVVMVSQCVMECAFSPYKEGCYGFNVHMTEIDLYCELLYIDDTFPTCNNSVSKNNNKAYVLKVSMYFISLSISITFFLHNICVFYVFELFPTMYLIIMILFVDNEHLFFNGL